MVLWAITHQIKVTHGLTVYWAGEQCNWNKVERLPFLKVNGKPIMHEREMTCTEQLILKCRSSELEHGRKKPFDWHRRQDSKTEREGFEHQWFPNLSPACSWFSKDTAGNSGDTRPVFFWPLINLAPHVCNTSDRLTVHHTLAKPFPFPGRHCQLSHQYLPTLSSQV